MLTGKTLAVEKFISQFLTEQFIVEDKRGRLEFVKRKNPNLTDEQLTHIADADPTPHGEFIVWIGNQLVKGNVRLPEDASKLQSVLTEFARLKKIPAFNPKDINQYPTYGALAKKIEDSSSMSSDRQQAKAAESGQFDGIDGAQVLLDDIYEGDRWTIVAITKYNAADKLCRKTLSGKEIHWCIKDPKYFEDYKIGPESPLLLFARNGEQEVLAHVDSNQVKDRMDEELPDDRVKNFLIPLAKKVSDTTLHPITGKPPQNVVKSGTPEE